MIGMARRTSSWPTWNRDGKPDFVAAITQEHETVVAFLNEGGGRFRKETIYTAPHPAFGINGMQLVDLDGDGDLDVLLTNGDALTSPSSSSPTTASPGSKIAALPVRAASLGRLLRRRQSCRRRFPRQRLAGHRVYRLSTPFGVPAEGCPAARIRRLAGTGCSRKVRSPRHGTGDLRPFDLSPATSTATAGLTWSPALRAGGRPGNDVTIWAQPARQPRSARAIGSSIQDRI